jgi:murein DD-endopeptidase MepM/ murein hydrolase activator NlpD
MFKLIHDFSSSLIIISVAFCASPIYAEIPFTQFVYPVMAPRKSGDFGKRKHPIILAVRHHNGIDLAAPTGAPIRAVAEGVVVFADPYAKYGNLIVIDHGSKITTHYGHCHTIKVEPGAKVSAGQIIGTIGSTGGSTGSHLHFEVRVSGFPKHPEKYLPGLTIEGAG